MATSENVGLTEVLTAVASLLLVYLLWRWLMNPLRRIKGPAGLPLLGNLLSLDIEYLHMHLYEMAREYGAVTKFHMFNTPVVVVNSREACLECLVQRGTDFDGRPPLPRAELIMGKDVAALPIDHPDYLKLRRLFTTAMKAYGPGIAHFERKMQEAITEITNSLQEREGEVIDINELCNGFVSCVMASLIFGEKHSYTDEVCNSLYDMNTTMIKALDPMSEQAIFDLFPSLLKFKFIVERFFGDTCRKVTDFTQQRIDEAKKSFDPEQKRGCLDHFIAAQRELDEQGNSVISDAEVRGVLMDFVSAGMETSRTSLCQAFLDLAHDQGLQKRLQDQIESHFEPSHTIVLNDRGQLPLLEAYVYENVRYLSQLPFLMPHMTIRDSEVAGYKIPRGTRVLINNFYNSHNPDIYEDPFTVKPERFLDETGCLVKADHPARQSLLSFGGGRRFCPSELLARSEIYLFLANILQKFSIEPVGTLPERDVRKYKMGVIISPPNFQAKFVRRQQ